MLALLARMLVRMLAGDVGEDDGFAGEDAGEEGILGEILEIREIS